MIKAIFRGGVYGTIMPFTFSIIAYYLLDPLAREYAAIIIARCVLQGIMVGTAFGLLQWLYYKKILNKSHVNRMLANCYISFGASFIGLLPFWGYWYFKYFKTALNVIQQHPHIDSMQSSFVNLSYHSLGVFLFTFAVGHFVNNIKNSK